MAQSKKHLPQGVAYLTSIGGIVSLCLLHTLGIHIQLSPFALFWDTSVNMLSIAVGVVAVVMLSLLLRRQAEFYMLLRSQQKGLLLTTLGLSTLSLGFFDLSSLLLLLGMIGVLYCLMASYQDEHASFATFPMGLIVGLMVLFHPALLLLIPILIYLLYPLRSLSLRNVLGLLLGVFVVLWLVLPLSLLFSEYLLWQYCLSRWSEFISPESYFVWGQASWVAYLPWLIALGQWIVGSVLLSTYYTQDSVRGRDCGTVLTQLSAFLILLGFLGSIEQGVLFIKLAFVPLSIRTALLFTLYEVRINRIAFISYVTLLVLLSVVY